MHTDELVQMINNPGKVSIGTMNDFWDMGNFTGKNSDYKTMLTQLLEEHETIIISLRRNINVCDEKSGDAGTTDFLTTLMKQHEAIVCILRRYMNKALLKSTITSGIALHDSYNESNFE